MDTDTVQSGTIYRRFEPLTVSSFYPEDKGGRILLNVGQFPTGCTAAKSQRIRPALGPTQPPAQRVLRLPTRVVQRPERVVRYLPPPGADVTNKWSYTSTPSICLNNVDGEHKFVYDIRYRQEDNIKMNFK